jgi:murein L,D-transpeptidase YafK
MKRVSVTLALVVCSVFAFGQASSFVGQRISAKLSNMIRLREDTLKKELAVLGIGWPLKQIYIRSFKYDSQLEVWVRGGKNDAFKLFRTYKVCALSGALGPKRIEGDYQVPEGFYYINEFKPNSTYNMALASYAHEQGQDFIPVHIFPIRYNVERSKEVLAKSTKGDSDYQKFSGRLKEVFDYFEQHKKIPLITVNRKGEYVLM